MMNDRSLPDIPEDLKPVLFQYLKRYQEDPNSRVFAPLAEAYRKAGLLKDAEEIAREGLRIHPGFLSGRVALARVLFDQQRYSEVIDELMLVVKDAPDNLAAQRLIGESALILRRFSDALSAYKMLLYYSPNDWEAARLVQELETQAYEQGQLLLKTEPERSEDALAFEIQPAQMAMATSPEIRRGDWATRIERLQVFLQRIERYRQNSLKIG